MLEIFDGCEFAFERKGEQTLTITVMRDKDTVGVGVDISPNGRETLFEDLTIKEVFSHFRGVIEEVGEHAEQEWNGVSRDREDARDFLLLAMLDIGEKIAQVYREERDDAIKAGDYTQALEAENHLFKFQKEGHEKVSELLEKEVLTQLFKELDIDMEGSLGDFLKDLKG